MGFSGSVIPGIVSPNSPGDKTSYDTIWDTSMTAIDAHDHTNGKGARIGTTAITDNVITTTQLSSTAAGTLSIAANAVTFAKLFSRTVHATAATEGNVLLTAATTWNSTTSSLSAIPDLTGTVVTTGRPVLVGILNTNSGGTGGNGAGMLAQSAADVPAFGEIVVKRNGTQIMGGIIYLTATATLGGANPVFQFQTSYPMFTIDTPAAGTHTYAAYFRINGGATSNFIIYNQVLTAVEL